MGMVSAPPDFADYLKPYQYEELPLLHHGWDFPLISMQGEESSCSCGIMKKTQSKDCSNCSSDSLFHFDSDEDSCFDSERDCDSSCSSGTCNTPSKGSRRVSFADEYGKELVAVRVFSADKLPLSPVASPITIRRARSLGHVHSSCAGNSTSSTSKAPVPRLTFEQPAADFHTFMKRLKQNKVCLENLIVTEKSLFGTIKVENICYDKEVFVRCTFDRWASFLDIPAVYVPCCDSETTINTYDMFSFETTLSQGQGVYHSIEFAVCFKTQGRQYWDNNDGKNYTVLCDMWYDSDSKADSSVPDFLDTWPTREECKTDHKYGELPEFDFYKGLSHCPRSIARLRRNFCLYY